MWNQYIRGQAMHRFGNALAASSSLPYQFDGINRLLRHN